MGTPKGWHSPGFPHRDHTRALLGFNNSFIAPAVRLEPAHPGPAGAHQPTFALPVGVSRETDVPPVFAVELCHQSLVGVSDEQDGRIEGFDLLLAAFMGFDANRPAASPVVSLALEPCQDRASGCLRSGRCRC